ncbi:hypothetical protein H0H93_016811, partial [Arthromyces matolae]
DWTVENEGNIEEDAFRGREGASNHATHASAEAELAKVSVFHADLKLTATKQIPYSDVLKTPYNYD